MYHHVKSLMYTVRVGEPDPSFGNMLLEQFGGANGELAAAMQYTIQGLNCEDPARKDLLMDIGTEELSHLEIVGTLARLHLKPTKYGRDAAEADPLVAIAGGGGVNLFNSQGNPWTADYLKITGELDVDLRSNIAAEARAKIVYERLINFCDDAGTRDALQFLMTREITHMKAFTLALETMGKPRFVIGHIAPTAGLVQQYFNDSTGMGQYGETDVRDAWNQGDDWEFVESPVIAQNGVQPGNGLTGERTEAVDNEILRELFVEQLQDLYDAEKQLVRALPTMVAAAETPALRTALEVHLNETRMQESRLADVFKMLSVTPASRTCKGMAGLIEEGNELISRASDKELTARDLSLIAAAQKVEHYEIAAYSSARVMAQQLGLPDVSFLLSKSLAEEENADSVLNTCALPLMTEAKLVGV
ncbi:MAG: katN [Bryobacterales bacterium]|nr:katN [Bryobacterales bacterium]